MPFKSSGKEQVSQYFSGQRKCGTHKGKYCIDGKSSLMSTNVSDHDLSRLSDNEICLQLIISYIRA